MLQASGGAAQAAAPADDIVVDCTVFHDLNGDGQRQGGEPALPGVGVTNGVTTALTDGTGSLQVTVDRALYRFATLRVPAGYRPTTPWYLPVPVGTPGPVSVDFGLRTEPGTLPGATVRWAHISDTQIRSWSETVDMTPDLQAINDLAEPPLFVVNTGDLVEVGSDSTHWNNYVSQLATLNAPMLVVPGNHDTLGTSTPLASYEAYAGPPYYDMDIGDWRFVFYNSENAAVGTPAVDQWLDGIFTAVPPSTHLALFQHRALGDISQVAVAGWASRGVDVAFSGHWHSHSFARHSSGIREYNLSRTTLGPNDRTPRVFGIVECTPAGEVVYDLRRLDVDHRAQLAFPDPTRPHRGNVLEVLVQAYDTSSPVTSLTANVSNAVGRLAPVVLAQEGVSLWRGTADMTGRPAGTYQVSVSGSFQDGQSISLGGSFQHVSGAPAVPGTGEAWPMFRKSVAGSSFTATPLAPPLDLAWSAPVPGMVALSSPVVANGRVYLGCRGESGNVDDSGILCCDAATGAVLWFAPVPGGVALAPAVDGNRVIATAMTDSVVALDAATGQPAWKTKVPGIIYKLVAPVVADGRVWAGGEPRIAQLDGATGAVQWTSALLGSMWYSTMYTAPAVDASRVYCSFYGTPGNIPDGFSILDRATGAAVHQENGAYRSPLVTADRLYLVGGVTPVVQVVTARTLDGTPVWVSPKLLDQGTSSPALGHGVLVVGGANGQVEAFRASDGANLWTHQSGTSLNDVSPNRLRVRDVSATAAIADSVVYIGSADGNLYALDLATGAELARNPLGASILSSAAVSGNMLFVAANDNHLYGFVSSVTSPPPGTPAGPPDGGRATLFALLPPQPNPSREEVRLEWVLPATDDVRVDVVDIAGRVVKTVLQDRRGPGEHYVVWDGRDEQGRPAAAGIYFVTLRAGDLAATRKIVRLRP
jgi:outer membrane protein assembly factor BamB